MHYLLTIFFSIAFLSSFSIWNINRIKVKYFYFSSCERFFYFYFLFFIYCFYSSHLIPYIPSTTFSVGDWYQSYQQPLSEETSSWDFYHEGLCSTSILLFSPILFKFYNPSLLSSLSSWLFALSLFLEFLLSTFFLSLYSLHYRSSFLTIFHFHFHSFSLSFLLSHYHDFYHYFASSFFMISFLPLFLPLIISTPPLLSFFFLSILLGSGSS